MRCSRFIFLHTKFVCCMTGASYCFASRRQHLRLHERVGRMLLYPWLEEQCRVRNQMTVRCAIVSNVIADLSFLDCLKKVFKPLINKNQDGFWEKNAN